MRNGFKMTINRTVELIDFYQLNNDLITEVVNHEVASTVTNLNSLFDNSYAIRSRPQIENLLSSINIRLRRLQMINSSYFKDLKLSIINGSNIELPFKADYTFFFETNVLINNIDINSSDLYKEIIDGQFQTFILTTASVYENIVRLIEILSRKIIIHKTQLPPLNTPFLTYLDFLDSLIRLKYRNDDPLKRCTDRFSSFFTTYLPTVNSLRNSFIHGFNSNLEYRSNSYRITKHQRPLTELSPQLDMLDFCENITDNSINFYRDLINVLIAEVTSSSIGIPF